MIKRVPSDLGSEIAASSQLPGWLSVAPALRSVGTGLRLSESRR
jgi:hypothetical protein